MQRVKCALTLYLYYYNKISFILLKILRNCRLNTKLLETTYSIILDCALRKKKHAKITTNFNYNVLIVGNTLCRFRKYSIITSLPRASCLKVINS